MHYDKNALFKLGLLFLIAILMFSMQMTTSALGYVIDQPLIPEGVELIIEIINVTLGVVVAIMAAYIARLLKDTHFENGWKLIMVATVIFAFFEIYGLLEAINIVRFSGLKDILEFLTIASLLSGMIIIFRSYQHYAKMLDEEE